LYLLFYTSTYAKFDISKKAEKETVREQATEGNMWA